MNYVGGQTPTCIWHHSYPKNKSWSWNLRPPGSPGPKFETMESTRYVSSHYCEAQDMILWNTPCNQVDHPPMPFTQVTPWTMKHLEGSQWQYFCISRAGNLPNNYCTKWLCNRQRIIWAMTKTPGGLGFAGEYTTQLCGGFIINHCSDLYTTTRIQWKARPFFFFRGSSGSFRTHWLPPHQTTLAIPACPTSLGRPAEKKSFQLWSFSIP